VISWSKMNPSAIPALLLISLTSTLWRSLERYLRESFSEMGEACGGGVVVNDVVANHLREEAGVSLCEEKEAAAGKRRKWPVPNIRRTNGIKGAQDKTYGCDRRPVCMHETVPTEGSQGSKTVKTKTQ
jgi:hypothetical protein